MTSTPGKRAGTRNGRTNGNNLRIPKLADPIGVYCRVRPWGQSDGDRCVKIASDKEIVLTPPENSMAWKMGSAKEMTFSFEKVYGPETEQSTLFENVALPLVKVFDI